MKEKQLWVLIVLGLLLLIGWFYWFEWRPSHIKQECAKYMRKLSDSEDYSISEAEGVIRICERDHGL